MKERTKRAEMLLGPEAMEKLAGSRVAVFGLGGVGSWCAEALARSGVGSLVLVDNDSVSESNMNRQGCASYPTLGMPKAQVMARKLRDIAPDAELTAMDAFYEPAGREQFFARPLDYIADCIDSVGPKVDLIVTAHARNIPILSALGTGNKLDASKLEFADLSQTNGCPLARVVRRELRRRGIEHHPVVFSTETALPPLHMEEPEDGRRSVPGSVMWVPATAGLLMAQRIVLELAHSAL